MVVKKYPDYIRLQGLLKTLKKLQNDKKYKESNIKEKIKCYESKIKSYVK